MSLDDFSLIHEVGRGAFGRVWVAQDKRRPGALLALKMLDKRDSLIRRSVQRIVSEKELLQRLVHPFIVKLHYAFQSADALCLAMEFIDGGTLRQLTERCGRLDEELARFIVAEVVLGLEFLHGEGVVFRDLKAENILLRRSGHLVLADFGLAKRIAGGGEEDDHGESSEEEEEDDESSDDDDDDDEGEEEEGAADTAGSASSLSNSASYPSPPVTGGSGRAGGGGDWHERIVGDAEQPDSPASPYTAAAKQAQRQAAAATAAAAAQAAAAAASAASSRRERRARRLVRRAGGGDGGRGGGGGGGGGGERKADTGGGPEAPQTAAAGEKEAGAAAEEEAAWRKDAEERMSIVGTPLFLAPEVIQGVEYGFEVDYWALGIILYEMLCETHPFDNTRRTSTMGALERPGGKGGGRNDGRNDGTAAAAGGGGGGGVGIGGGGGGGGAAAVSLAPPLPPKKQSGKDLFVAVMTKPVKFPSSCRSLAAATRGFVRSLLAQDPSQRLGYRGDAARVKGHAFFTISAWDWAACARREIPPPPRPETPRLRRPSDLDDGGGGGGGGGATAGATTTTATSGTGTGSRRNLANARASSGQRQRRPCSSASATLSGKQRGGGGGSAAVAKAVRTTRHGAAAGDSFQDFTPFVASPEAAAAAEAAAEAAAAAAAAAGAPGEDVAQNPVPGRGSGCNSSDARATTVGSDTSTPGPPQGAPIPTPQQAPGAALIDAMGMWRTVDDFLGAARQGCADTNWWKQLVHESVLVIPGASGGACRGISELVALVEAQAAPQEPTGGDGFVEVCDDEDEQQQRQPAGRSPLCLALPLSAPPVYDGCCWWSFSADLLALDIRGSEHVAGRPSPAATGGGEAPPSRRGSVQPQRFAARCMVGSDGRIVVMDVQRSW